MAPADGDEEGFIDLIESSQVAFAKVTEVLGRMTTAISELGENIRRRAGELQGAKAESGQVDFKTAKPIIARAASDLHDYVARTEVEVPLFAEYLKQAIGEFGKAASILPDFGQEGARQLREALTAVRTLRTSMLAARGQMKEFRTSIAGSPRMTTVYNRARRATLATVDSVLKEFETAEHLAEEIDKSMVAIISRFEIS